MKRPTGKMTMPICTLAHSENVHAVKQENCAAYLCHDEPVFWDAVVPIPFREITIDAILSQGGRDRRSDEADAERDIGQACGSSRPVVGEEVRGLVVASVQQRSVASERQNSHGDIEGT
jgi:hypothetical protein